MWPRQLIYPGLVPLNPYLIPYFNTQQHLSTDETGYKGFSEKNEGALCSCQPNQALSRQSKTMTMRSSSLGSRLSEREGNVLPSIAQTSRCLPCGIIACPPPRSLHCKCLSSVIQLHVLPQIPVAQRERQSLNLSANMKWVNISQNQFSNNSEKTELFISCALRGIT